MRRKRLLAIVIDYEIILLICAIPFAIYTIISRNVNVLIQENFISREQCLFGFPHPSGANGHRKEHFLLHQDFMIQQLETYFKEKSLFL